MCCPHCLKENISEKSLPKSLFKRIASTNDSINKTAGGLNEISNILVEMKSGQSCSTDGEYLKAKSLHTYYTWMIEECILAAYNKSSVQCPTHGDINLNDITPDVKFLDLPKNYLIKSSDITKGTLLGNHRFNTFWLILYKYKPNVLAGRGAFGFVFKSTVKRVGHESILCAMKMLQPVNPGTFFINT